MAGLGLLHDGYGAIANNRGGGGCALSHGDGYTCSGAHPGPQPDPAAHGYAVRTHSYCPGQG